MRKKLLGTSIGLMFYQLVILLFVTGGRFDRLVHWDAIWYRDIAVLGYDANYPLKHEATGGSNIAFFPAFPLSVRGLTDVFHLPPDFAVAFAAQLACIGLWAYFLLLIKRLGARPGVAFACVGFFLVQPGAFYTVIGYSEALFTASMLGALYWAVRTLEEPTRKPWHFALAVLHGSILSGTRLVGVSLAGFALILAICRALREKKLEARPIALALALGALSLSGVAAFLIYCQVKWGHWDAYWEANRVGWHVFFDPWKMFHWEWFRDVFFFGNLSEVLGRIITIITLGYTIALTVWAWRRRFTDALPLAICLLDVGLSLQTAIGSHGMHSMVRYLIPIHALTFVAAAGWLEEKARLEKVTLGNWLTYAGVTLFLFAIQVMFSIRYSHSDWVS